MVSVLTGDIINSRKSSPQIWMPVLKKALGRFGSQPQKWELYRGDSFQLQIDDPAEALEAAIYIKASVKRLNKLDVRIAIGISTKAYSADRITESTGTAFEFSGALYESLKKQKRNMAVKSVNDEFDEEINLYIRLALIAMDKWTTKSAEIMATMLENPGLAQHEVGELLHIRQNAVSSRLKRAHYHELTAFLKMYRKKVKMML